MENAFKQLSARTDMEVELDYQIQSVLLNPNEEIHVLQIFKEAVQNAMYHSKGTRVSASVWMENGNINMTT